MNCLICKQPIHASRLESSPRAKTCSKPCSKRHQRNLKRINAKRQRERRRHEHIQQRMEAQEA